MDNISTSFGDIQTTEKRMGWFKERQLAKTRVNPKIAKVVKTVLWVCVAMWAFTLMLNVIVDNQIKAKQLANLIKYHDVNGFQPVH